MINDSQISLLCSQHDISQCCYLTESATMRSYRHLIYGTKYYLQLFNMSIQSGIFPEKWKLSSVVPIPKDGDLSNPSNYRLISRLSVVSKMLERHVHFLLTQHLASDHPLANSQWGFQSGKSTVAALLATTYDWFQELIQAKELAQYRRKAFDTVPHRKLIEKLCQLDVLS